MTSYPALLKTMSVWMSKWNLAILDQMVLEIFAGLISCRTNEHIEAYHIRQKGLAGVRQKILNINLFSKHDCIDHLVLLASTLWVAYQASNSKERAHFRGGPALIIYQGGVHRINEYKWQSIKDHSSYKKRFNNYKVVGRPMKNKKPHQLVGQCETRRHSSHNDCRL